MIMLVEIRIENWSIVNDYRLHGNVYNHLRFDDGTEITTSRIFRISGRFIITSSGTEYVLGVVSEEYLNWCKENKCHLPVGDNPIKVKIC